MKLMTFERLEPYAVKVARTVLRREGRSDLSNLSDPASRFPLGFVSKICGKLKLRFSFKVLKVISGSGAVTRR